MLKTEYMYLFILCAYLSQGIIATFLKEDIGKELNAEVREKRVVNRMPGEDEPVNRGEVPYVVSIKYYMRLHCMGTILSHNVAITAARCVNLELSRYTVLSGSTYTHHGTSHNITETKMRGHNPSRSSTFLTGIALIKVNPPFVFRIGTDAIDLNTEPILPGMVGTISGFGSSTRLGRTHESRYPKRLRSITVSIIGHTDCKHSYSGIFPITEEDICTYHEQKQCLHTDAGAPLVVDRLLAGVHIGEVDTAETSCPVKPDVFLLLQNLQYGPWIREYINSAPY